MVLCAMGSGRGSQGREVQGCAGRGGVAIHSYNLILATYIASGFLEREESRYMCARFPGTMSLSSPTSAFPVARTRFSPLAVKGSSVVPVWRPLSDHSVSPWRIIKTRGSGMMM